MLLIRTVVLVTALAGSLAVIAADKGPGTKTGFVPPPAAQRAAAIGELKLLTPTLKRALIRGPTSAPMGEPKPGEWLAEHKEAGQTFDAFVASRPNRPDKQRNVIYVVPLGEFDPEWSPKLADLAACAEAFFRLEVKTLPNVALEGRSITSRERGAGRTQYLSTDLLDLLRSLLPPDGYCIVGVTMQDLYPKASWNFVFGQASLRDRVGVYSFARYDPQFEGKTRTPEAKTLLMSRSCGVLVHETSHMFGMQHCTFYECVVNGSNSLAESDEQPLHLCPVCLRKLQHSVEFDVVDRYRRQRDVYRRIGLDDEADWINRRLAWINVGENP